MIRISKILLPVDFSAQGEGAAKWAGALARHFRAELTLLHVNPISVPAITIPHEFTGPIDTGWVTALEAQGRHRLDSYRASNFSDVRVKRVVVTGDPAQKIVEIAHADKTGMIVMPTHGYGPFRRFLLGSVAAKVLHDAGCPVWTGAHLEHPAPLSDETIAHVLCAIDNGPSSERVLEWAWDFSSSFHALLTVVHAVPALEPPDDFLDSAGALQRTRAAEERVRCWLKKVGARGGVVVEPGEASHVVARAAARVMANVVVIGRTPEDGIFGRLRANAYAIIRESPCPVASV